MKQSPGPNLKARRLALGMSRDALAALIRNPGTEKPVRLNSLYRWEAGERSPSPVLMRRWVAAIERAEEARR